MDRIHQLIFNHLKANGIRYRKYQFHDPPEYYLLYVTPNTTLANGYLSLTTADAFFTEHTQAFSVPHQISFGDPELLTKITEFLEQIKAICPNCHNPGSPSVCGDCRDQWAAEYEADLRTSRGY